MVTTNISLQIISLTTLLHSQSKTIFPDNTCFYINYNKYDYDHEFKDSFMFIAKGLYVLLNSTTQTEVELQKKV